MNRAAILIGVQQAQTLPKLQAVWDGVRGMKEWALSQGIDKDLVRTITDETGKVTPQQIKDAVSEFAGPGDLDQLIIYFAGHGVNVRRGEYWLLSDAIDDADAAVNVAGSVDLARCGVIPHVVFVSDACRTAAVGIQAGGITGSVIFPNKPVLGREKFVDLFFATLLGEPSVEIANPGNAKKFRAVYTETLLEALRGQHPEITKPDSETGLRLVRPWPLKQFLEKELPNRVHQATLGPSPRDQQPDARLTSDPDGPNVWLSALKLPEPTVTHPVHSRLRGSNRRAERRATLTQIELSRPQEAMRTVLTDSNSNIDEVLGVVRGIAVPPSPVGSQKRTDPNQQFVSDQNQQFADGVLRTAEPFGPMHFESDCGFKIRGAKVTRCDDRQASAKLLDHGTLVRVKLHDGEPCVSVLLTLDNGHGVLLPAIRDFLATLTFDGLNLVDVAYEPSDNSYRWQEYQQRATELRNLRAVIASSSRLGTFRLEGTDAETLARRMQISKGIDPSLALYAAHAYRDQGNRQRIREMADYMQGDLNICLFDIALLAGLIKDPIVKSKVFPFLPMLSQSWALMAAYEVDVPPLLKGMSRHVSTDSLWTLFDADGVGLISQVIQEGKVR